MEQLRTSPGCFLHGKWYYYEQRLQVSFDDWSLALGYQMGEGEGEGEQYEVFEVEQL
jgi:hypothetical protein